MPPKKDYKDYVAARRAFAAGRSSASRQSMLVRPAPLANPRIYTERKYFDSQYAALIATTTTDFASAEAEDATGKCLFYPVTGDDYNNRTGRKIQVLSIKIHGFFSVAAQADQAAADTPGVIRVCLVQDKQTNAAQLNSEDVLTSGSATQAVNFFQNPAFFGRFKVWKDKTYVLQNPTMSFDGTNVEQSGLSRTFKWTLKFKNPVVVHYNATNGGTIADVIDNSFHIIAGTNNASLAQNINYKVRTTFVDV